MYSNYGNLEIAQNSAEMTICFKLENIIFVKSITFKY